ncbi:Protein NRT1/ PTR FAMILY 5.3 [Ananas comosus]|uniref:Protein NRT1/ PTR FAMILY 5.3 n=1 Tax=Ananas comosus TaxID=4615 RepID=A0A199VMC7_ANACO|nr:Protein NRT1/ PTR FAMILY 5.3 [Ananas comosus]
MVEDLESEHAQREYTEDGSVDLRGNPILRCKRGGWTACSFIVVYEVFERMAFYGIASNLVLYVTNKLHQGTVDAANNVTNWAGTVFLMPILGAYVADAYLGRYWTFVIGSAIYLLVIFITVLFSHHSFSCSYTFTCLLLPLFPAY